MPRPTRRIEAGMIFHVLNRGNGRRALFSKDADYAAFRALLAEAAEKFPVDMLAYCLMKNHWHLLLRPRKAEALSRMLAWVTVTHARRHHMHYPNPGTGHLYQGRYKSFPVQSDEHFLTVARYIHANPARAKLVARAEAWPWSDLKSPGEVPMSQWPVDRPKDWLRWVNRPLEEAEQAALMTSLERGTPFGPSTWVTRTARRLNLAGSLRPLGRPKKPTSELSPRYRKQLERLAMSDK